MQTNAYITFLVIGVLMVVIDGQIIYRSGQRYLENSYGDPEASASMTRLITVLFHLAVLGLLALLSIVDMGVDNPLQAVIAQLGVMLLVLAAAHAVTLGVLARIREDQVAESWHGTAGDARLGTKDAQHGAVATPVPGQRGRDPRVSPTLEHGSAYSTGDQ